MTDDTEEHLVLTDEAVKIMFAAYQRVGENPKTTIVLLMTAAAMSGHMVDLDKKTLHEILDKVDPVAMAKIASITETQH